MNILVISFVASHNRGNNAGNINYIYNINKYFQKLGHKIYFFYIHIDKANYNLQAMQMEWDKVFVVKDYNLWKNFKKKQFDFADISSFQGLAKDICANYKIDMCICHYFVYSKLLEVLPNNVIKVIDTHDKFTKRSQYLLKNLAPASYFNISTEQKEAVYLNRADIIIAKTKEEANFFNRITNSNKAIVIPFISSENNLFVDKKYKSLKTIGFVGSSNIINLMGILKFLNAFDKEYEKGDLQDIKIKIAGAALCGDFRSIYTIFTFKRRLKLFLSYITFRTFINLFKPNLAKNFVKSIHKKPYFINMGFIDNLENFYKEIDLIIIPTSIGTGINIKTGEAVERGLPFLSTSNGIKGFNSNERYHNVKDMDTMVKYIKEIRSKPSILQTLANKSKEMYVEYLKTFKEGVYKLFNK